MEDIKSNVAWQIVIVFASYINNLISNALFRLENRAFLCNSPKRRVVEKRFYDTKSDM